MRLLFTICCALALLSACGNQATPVANQSNANPPAANTNAQTAQPSSTAPAGKMPAGVSMAVPVDTSHETAEIARLQKQAGKGEPDAATKLALAKAYLARGNALTKAKQYRAALGDYRRTLKYDPDNAEAQQMSNLITDILKQMGRDIPPEGQEPTPLPLKQ
ncbi:MAG: tetratricopeptide repeat protein [Pyrinomonadaceae bacterium]